jgi:hypothetical protein
MRPSPSIISPRTTPLVHESGRETDLWRSRFIGLAALALVCWLFCHPPQHFATRHVWPSNIPQEQKSVAQVVDEEYDKLPPCLPFSLATDAHGRPSFWVAVRDKGTVQNLPATGEIGDEYHLPDGSSFIWMLPAGKKFASWVDP